MSAYFSGGVVSYSNEAKAALLGVDPGLIERHGAVSMEVAEAMADGALERFGADFAISTTGIAGQDGGTREKPVGTVFWCVKEAGGEAVVRGIRLPGDNLARHVFEGQPRHFLRLQRPPVKTDVLKPRFAHRPDPPRRTASR